MTFAVRGVIEGFYGRPWSWSERASMVDFMGKHGYNLYVYAPKNDPIHRNRWQEPYLPEELARFKQLNDQCRELGMTFCFGISPLQYHYNSEAYFDILWGKLLPLYNLGVRSFTVLLDDMPDKFHHADDEARFGTIAKAQVWLNNTVLERLEALGDEPVSLLFCPTEYHGTGVSDYLTTLGEELRPEIDVFWTGTEICAQYLRTDDARRVSESLKRPVLYWDNYPVNDGEMRWRPHIRPIRGRDADLDTACRGIVSNGSLQPEATKISLHTYAAYMADPVNYEPEVAWQKALLELCGNAEDAAAVAVLGDLTRWSALERGKQLHNQLGPKLNRFWKRWGGVPAVAGPDLPGISEMVAPPPGAQVTLEAVEVETHDEQVAVDRQAALTEIATEFTRLRAAADRLQGPMANQQLQTELMPWIEKMAGWVDVGQIALDVLRHALNGEPFVAEKREAMLDRLLENRENFHWVNGDMVDQFARRVLWAAAELEAEARA